MSIHRVIREGRERLGLSEHEFAKRCGVTRGAVQHWEREGGTAPKRGRLQVVADVLGLTTAELVGAENVHAGPEVKGSVPLLSGVQAGEYKLHVDNLQPGEGERIETTVPVKRHTFALRVEGDSMMPEFAPGAILIVEPEMDPMPGDFVIARSPDGDTTFKQLVRDNGEYLLKPLNERYQIKPLGKSRIIGVVRAVERRFR